MREGGEGENIKMKTRVYKLMKTMGCKDAYTPIFTDEFGWLVKIKSIHDGLFVFISVGLFIN